jgi:hypothetical protein
MKHAIGADVLIDVRPVHSVSISNQRPIGSLLRFGVGEAPRPGERHADDTPVNQVGGDRLVRDIDVIDARFNADRTAHARSR